MGLNEDGNQIFMEGWDRYNFHPEQGSGMNNCVPKFT